MEERKNMNYLLDDISNELLMINKTTIERLFEEPNHNVLVLYIFYYKTAKWQNHNPIKASDEYCKKCLHWGTDTLRTAKKRLEDMDLISIEKRRNDKNQIEGWYVRIKYYNSKIVAVAPKNIDISTQPDSRTPDNLHLGSQNTNTIDITNINTNNNNNNNMNIIYNWEQNLKCECLTQNNTVCERRSSFSINGINHCNQHAKGKIGTYFSSDKEIYKEICDYLNLKAGTSYKPIVKSTIKHINARLEEGFTLDDFKTVIDKKCDEWLNDETMEKYLRPETLFSTKFEGYLNQKKSYSNNPINNEPEDNGYRHAMDEFNNMTKEEQIATYGLETWEKIMQERQRQMEEANGTKSN